MDYEKRSEKRDEKKSRRIEDASTAASSSKDIIAMALKELKRQQMESMPQKLEYEKAPLAGPYIEKLFKSSLDAKTRMGKMQEIKDIVASNISDNEKKEALDELQNSFNQ